MDGEIDKNIYLLYFLPVCTFLIHFSFDDSVELMQFCHVFVPLPLHIKVYMDIWKINNFGKHNVKDLIFSEV